MGVAVYVITENVPKEMIAFASDILQLKTILLLLSLFVPAAMFFAGLILSISFYAKSFKEAQSITQPLLFAIFFPVISGTFIPGIHLNNFIALIPILNVALASKEIVAGTAQLFPIFLVYLSSTIIAGLGLYVCR